VELGEKFGAGIAGGYAGGAAAHVITSAALASAVWIVFFMNRFYDRIGTLY